MKNEKLHEILNVVIKVISIVSVIAQAIKTAFPADTGVAGESVTYSEQKKIMEFLKED